MSRVKKARQRALRNAVEKNMTADDRLKEQMAANQMLSKVPSYTTFLNVSFNDCCQGVQYHEGEQGDVWRDKL